jgi:replicative DNA helicase
VLFRSLSKMLTVVPTSLNAETYGRKVKEYAMRRSVLAAASALARSAYDLDQPIDTGIVSGSQALDTLASQATSHSVGTLADILPDVYGEIEARAKAPKEIWGIPTGLPHFDIETGGQHPGELTVLAGEPGMGKSWLMLSMAREMVRHSPGAIFTLEMSPKALTYRLLSGEACVRSKQLRNGFIAEADWGRISTSIEALEEVQLFMDGKSRTCGTIRAVLANLVNRRGVRWFFVDYLTLLDEEGKDDTERSANASRALKCICTDLDVAGIVINSIVKSGMDRDNGADASAKSNLRGSGQVIHDADLVLFLTQYVPDSRLSFVTEEEKKSMATLWCKKGRELEDPRLRIGLVRRKPSPFFGELAK